MKQYACPFASRMSSLAYLTFVVRNKNERRVVTVNFGHCQQTSSHAAPRIV